MTFWHLIKTDRSRNQCQRLLEPPLLFITFIIAIRSEFCRRGTEDKIEVPSSDAAARTPKSKAKQMEKTRQHKTGNQITNQKQNTSYYWLEYYLPEHYLPEYLPEYYLLEYSNVPAIMVLRG